MAAGRSTAKRSAEVEEVDEDLLLERQRCLREWRAVPRTVPSMNPNISTVAIPVERRTDSAYSGSLDSIRPPSITCPHLACIHLTIVFDMAEIRFGFILSTFPRVSSVAGLPIRASNTRRPVVPVNFFLHLVVIVNGIPSLDRSSWKCSRLIRNVERNIGLNSISISKSRE